MGRNFVLTNNQVTEAVRLYGNGYSASKIADICGVSSGAVKNALRSRGVVLRSIKQHYDVNPVTIEKIRLNCIEDENGCWLWQGHVRKNGYCRTTVRRKPVYVHRLAYKLAKGRMPPSHLDVRHDCDNRRCCNPDHLIAGTRLANMLDAKAKGRLSTGVLHGLAVKRGHARTGYSPATKTHLRKEANGLS